MPLVIEFESFGAQIRRPSLGLTPAQSQKADVTHILEGDHNGWVSLYGSRWSYRYTGPKSYPCDPWPKTNSAVFNRSQSVFDPGSCLAEYPAKKNPGPTGLKAVLQGLQERDVPTGLGLGIAMIFQLIRHSCPPTQFSSHYPPSFPYVLTLLSAI